uniref:F-box and regulator of chromosome condensation repeat protein n=1 Tax=Pithovirus LCPAC302 TaxID=2506593 RepID=A0A481Z882_9VIRU|nr:MAG: F-box and regulator of chromosome condensation repeat protein [Pithovirus LCPAC302]
MEFLPKNILWVIADKLSNKYFANLCLTNKRCYNKIYNNDFWYWRIYIRFGLIDIYLRQDCLGNPKYIWDILTMNTLCMINLSPETKNGKIREIMTNVKYVSCTDELYVGVITTDNKLFIFTKESTPAKIMDNIKHVSCNKNYTGVITTDNQLFMFGNNEYGQLGTGDKNNRSKPTHVMNDIKYVSCGADYTGVITTDNKLFMFGNNDYGQLGTGDTKDRLKPIEIMNKVRYVSCGDDYTGVITMDNKLFMFGYNNLGQLGTGDTKDRLKPTEIMNNVRYVSCGGWFTGVVTIDKQLFMFGWGNYGQLGRGHRIITEFIYEFDTYICTPKNVMNNVKYVSCGPYHTGVITIDNKLFTFGTKIRCNYDRYEIEYDSTPRFVMDNVRYIDCTLIIH